VNVIFRCLPNVQRHWFDKGREWSIETVHELERMVFPIGPATDLYLFLAVRSIHQGNTCALNAAYPTGTVILTIFLPGKLLSVLVKDTQEFFAPVSAEMALDHNFSNGVSIHIVEIGISRAREQR
jgi:hypothetical protein